MIDVFKLAVIWETGDDIEAQICKELETMNLSENDKCKLINGVYNITDNHEPESKAWMLEVRDHVIKFQKNRKTK